MTTSACRRQLAGWEALTTPRAVLLQQAEAAMQFPICTAWSDGRPAAVWYACEICTAVDALHLTQARLSKVTVTELADVAHHGISDCASWPAGTWRGNAAWRSASVAMFGKKLPGTCPCNDVTGSRSALPERSLMVVKTGMHSGLLVETADSIWGVRYEVVPLL